MNKKFDIFVSHSSRDKPLAERMSLALELKGYTVWLDTKEILVGDDLVTEVFQGVADSNFVVVLLSEVSVQSNWVREEYSAAKVREIEESQVVILPAKIEECEIPPPLKTKKYADFSQSWDYGFREILNAIEGHVGRQSSSTDPGLAIASVGPPNYKELDQWREGLIREMIDAGFVEGQPFKDILIGPIDGSSVNIERTQLQSLVENSRVRLSGWFGLPFPFAMETTTQQIHLQSGLRFVDSNLRLYGPRTFHFCQIDSTLKFFHQNPVGEDQMGNDNNGNSLAGTLIRSWILSDIMCPLLFAKNLVSNVSDLHGIGVKLVWGGLSGRILREVSQNRWGFLRRHQCQVSEWIFETEITAESDLAAEGLRAANDLFWLFGWVPDAGLYDLEFEKFASGHFPG